MDNITFQEPNEMFDKAIKAGHLSAIPSASNYAGNFMYMGTLDEGQPNEMIHFKHSRTRGYVNWMSNQPMPDYYLPSSCISSIADLQAGYKLPDTVLLVIGDHLSLTHKPEYRKISQSDFVLLKTVFSLNNWQLNPQPQVN